MDGLLLLDTPVHQLLLSHLVDFDDGLKVTDHHLRFDTRGRAHLDHFLFNVILELALRRVFKGRGCVDDLFFLLARN